MGRVAAARRAPGPPGAPGAVAPGAAPGGPEIRGGRVGRSASKAEKPGSGSLLGLRISGGFLSHGTPKSSIF